MESLLIFLIVFLIILNVCVFFVIRRKPENTDNKTEQILKDEINLLKNSFSQSFGSMTKDIAKDMTGALTRVDEKVGVFNKQVEALNKSQENFSRILSGVKQYGVLAEFSLASLLKDTFKGKTSITFILSFSIIIFLGLISILYKDIFKRKDKLNRYISNVTETEKSNDYLNDYIDNM